MIFDVIIIILLFSVFAFLHSLLASNRIKKEIIKNLGEKIAFYRLFYNLSSLTFFCAFFFLSPKPDIIVYDLNFPFDIFTFVIQILSLVGLVWSFKNINIKEFLGISQIKRYINNNYKIEDLDEKQEFKIEGAYKIVRHPIYLFSIIFLASRAYMDLFYLVTFISIVIYFYIGSIYEENKMIEKYGILYKDYQKKVPRIFPLHLKKIMEKK